RPGHGDPGFVSHLQHTEFLRARHAVRHLGGRITAHHQGVTPFVRPPPAHNRDATVVLDGSAGKGLEGLIGEPLGLQAVLEVACQCLHLVRFLTCRHFNPSARNRFHRTSAPWTAPSCALPMRHPPALPAARTGKSTRAACHGSNRAPRITEWRYPRPCAGFRRPPPWPLTLPCGR